MMNKEKRKMAGGFFDAEFTEEQMNRAEENPLVYTKELFDLVVEIGNHFGEDLEAAKTWCLTPNPDFNNLIPNDLIRMGRVAQLRRMVTALVS